MSATIWPDIFVKENWKISDKSGACADGLTGWANCKAGNQPPENFGIGMQKIGILLEIIPSPENLMRYSDNLV